MLKNIWLKPCRFSKPVGFSMSDFSPDHRDRDDKMGSRNNKRERRNDYDFLKLALIGALFIFLFAEKASAQNEWLFSKYPGQIISVLDETYDGGILVQVFTDTTNAPISLIKYSMEGKMLWTKTLINISPITSIVNTADSGFVLTAQVYNHPVNSTSIDTSGNIALLKFDKCSQLQWGRYVKSRHEGAGPGNVVVGKNAYYVCSEGINGSNGYYQKATTLIKFSNNGSLVHYNSFEGDVAALYQEQGSDTLYLTQFLYIPIDTDTSTVYAFSGIRSVDTSLNPLGSVIIGYNQVYNAMGPLAFNGKTLRQASVVEFNSGREQALFSSWTKNLMQTGNFHYDTTENLADLFPTYSVSHHDSLIVCNWVQTRTSDTFFTSLRMYDINYNLIKESIINKNWFQQTESFLPLTNGDCIVSTLNLNLNTGDIDNCSLYLFDRKLNPIAWPTSPPTKGYDWACSSTIPDTQTINVAAVVRPVYIAPDYSRPNWKALTNAQPYTISDYCSNIPVVFTPFTYLYSPYFHWDFGDTVSGNADTSSQRTGVHLYKTPGIYRVHLMAWDYMGLNDTFTSKITISSGLKAVKMDTTLCSGETVTLDAGNPGAQYLWNNGDTIRSKKIGPGIFWVMVTNGACFITDTFHIGGPNGLKINTGVDTTVAKGKSLTLRTGYPTTVWSTGAIGDSIKVQSGTYWAMLKGNKCEISDTIRVLTVPGLDTNLCTGETITLDAGNTGAQYLWNDGHTGSTETVGPGTYWVKVSLGPFSITDSFHIIDASKATINLGNDTSIAIGKILTLHSGYSTTLWSTGAIGESIKVTQAGTYRAMLKGDTCEVSDSVNVMTYPPGPTRVKLDTNLCLGETVTLDAGNPMTASGFFSYRWNNGDNSRELKVGPGTYWVSVTNDSGTITDTFHVYAVNSAKINLGKDTTIAKGTTLTLHSPYLTTIWSTGVIGDFIQVTKAGTYWAALKGDKCEVSDTIDVMVKSGIDISTPNDISGIKLYPNPARNTLNISFNSIHNAGFNIKIYDAIGRLVLEQKYNSTIGPNAFDINIGTLPPGDYIFGMSSNDASTTKKFEIIDR